MIKRHVDIKYNIFKQEDLELIDSLIPQYPQRAVQENDGEHLAAVGLLLY